MLMALRALDTAGCHPNYCSERSARSPRGRMFLSAVLLVNGMAVIHPAASPVCLASGQVLLRTEHRQRSARRARVARVPPVG